jgi:hypothetical protein
LGAIYTLRGLADADANELSRSVKKANFHIRRNDYHRRDFAEASITGFHFGNRAIGYETANSSNSRRSLGVDGASARKATRKSITNLGSAFFVGLREVGGQAVKCSGSSRQQRARRHNRFEWNGGWAAKYRQSFAAISQENSFVMVRAGTEAYVLITDLPAEQREATTMS